MMNFVLEFDLWFYKDGLAHSSLSCGSRSARRGFQLGPIAVIAKTLTTSR